MNDLRSPLEDRPYRPASPAYGQSAYREDGNSFSAKFSRLRRHKLFPVASVVIALIVFGVIISYAYNQGSQSGVNATTPVVQAGNEDYKSKPENPGGMDVPFQDAVVFDQLQSKQAASSEEVESLLPAPEQPVTENTTENAAPPVADVSAKTEVKTDSEAVVAQEASVSKEAAAEPSIASTLKETATPAEPETSGMVAEKTTSETKVLEVKAPSAAPKNETAIKTASVASAKTSTAAKIEAGSYRVQLGAFRDEGAARAAWAKIKAQFSGQLGNVTPAFPRADLGDKGVFYRVQGVNLSKASAAQICEHISAAKGSCIVTQ